MAASPFRPQLPVGAVAINGPICNWQLQLTVTLYELPVYTVPARRKYLGWRDGPASARVDGWLEQQPVRMDASKAHTARKDTAASILSLTPVLVNQTWCVLRLKTAT